MGWPPTQAQAAKHKVTGAAGQAKPCGSGESGLPCPSLLPSPRPQGTELRPPHLLPWLEEALSPTRGLRLRQGSLAPGGGAPGQQASHRYLSQ